MKNLIAKNFTAFIFSVFVLLFMPSLAQAQTGQPAQHVKAHLISQTDYAVPGQVLRIGLYQQIEEGWHTYWINPGDSGLETRITFKNIPEGVEISPMKWPLPHAIPFESLVNYGYEENVLFPIDIKIPANFSGSHIRFQAEASWLVCKEICIPEQTQLTLTLPIRESNQPSDKFALFKEFEAQLPQLRGVNAHYTTKQKDLIFKFESRQNIKADYAYFFPYDWGILVFSEPQGVFIEGNDLFIKAKLDGSNLKNPVRGVLVVEVGGERKGYEIFAQELDTLIYPGMVRKTEGTSFDSLFKKSSGEEKTAPEKTAEAQNFNIAVLLLLAFIGGMILNLMPCVFPVLSIKALSLIRYTDKEPEKIKISGWFYSLGVVLSFAVIGGIIVAFKLAGAHVGWGFQLQSPVFVSVMALFLFLIGLNLIGFFELGTSLMGIGSKMTSKEGHSGSFWTGVLATIVATPCTAPFMATALGATLFLSATKSFLIFVALGAGMAFPYLLLTHSPRFFALLPKPGAWMESFKQFLAFPMFGFALWLVWVLSKQVNEEALLIFGFIALGTVFIIWLEKQKKTLLNFVLIALTVLLSFYGFYALSNMKKEVSMVASQNTLEVAYNPQTLKQYLKEKRPVLVNMTAAWCITCLANERVALSTDEVKTFMQKNNIVYMKGDWTNFDNDITEYLKEHGRTGVPLYVYYDGNGNKTILPQLLTPSIVIETLKGDKK